MRVPDEILTSVVFIGTKINEEDSYEFGGTGFFVVHESNAGRFLHLVTANHVAAQLHGNFAAFQVNLKAGGIRNIEIPADEKWFSHPSDNAVDIAVLLLNKLDETIDYTTVPSSMFLDQQSIRGKMIGIGNPVFFAGLFTGLGNKNTCVVRAGNIAIMPTGKVIPFKLNHRNIMLEGYVIEARSYGGMSGSPVFVRESTVLLGPNGELFTDPPFFGFGSFYLLGVGIGHWEIDESAINDNVPAGEREKLHRGLSIVAPAAKLLEVLNNPELENLRNRGR